MLLKLIFAFAFCTVLASFGSCGLLSDMDNLNITETGPIPGPTMRMSRNTKLADRCQTSDGYTGTCMSRINCMRQRGAVSGFCGTYGVCCDTNLLCGASSRQKTTIIKNPVTLPINNCPYIIEPYSSNVCQLHIYFELFSMAQPTIDDGTMTLTCSDYLDVNNLQICGDNAGQHIYIPFDVASGMDHVQLNFILTKRAPSIWRLIVTQLECPVVKTKRTVSSNSLLPFMGQNSLSDIRNIFSTHNSDLDLLAPPGCLQYFTARQGIFKSFNYNNFGGPYLREMTYAICFKRTFRDTAVQYTVENFQLSKQMESDIGYDEQCHTVVHTDMRKNDYLMIPQGMLVPRTSLQPTYFCGTSITTGDIIYSANEGPFVVYFSSDAMTDDAERGFQFRYEIK